ncbi:lipopolysaccharide heptosyltransferase I [Polynucleobacter sphagniphilus]|uniref:lipopolysaccharide heptosyltransferase I n=1 Tax=Polynucleobacter sphagniphilus TaxID=1743169 RepID=UPI00096B6BE2|nr:lipopolysaccharide heptosyltransferase I [Polynucleobacter sphagniphilus]OLY95980.1 lipopolysaccharide heptosyltransferase I [Polynucleobacter sphagniphilus]
MSNASANAPKILLVKLSSLGDVLHNLPIVWDLRARLPNAQIDWVVEEAYVHLLEPLLSKDGFRGIDRIIPLGLRRWKKSIFKINSWKQFFAFKKELQAKTYDVLIETQGLLKSALVCALANKSKDAQVIGLANATKFSGYEPLARAFYTESVQVPKQCHAVDRSRWLTCAAFDWPVMNRSTTPHFYPENFVANLANTHFAGIQKPYVLFFHSTARDAKRWPNESWVALGNVLAKEGYQVVLPWGNPAEKQVSEELALQIAGALVPKRFSIAQAFGLIAGAALTVGVDTGLTHLAAVLGKATVEIYCDSPTWKTEGYWSKQIRNTGDMGKSPSASEVIDASLELLHQA